MKGFDLSGLEDGAASKDDGPARRSIAIAPPPRTPRPAPTPAPPEPVPAADDGPDIEPTAPAEPTPPPVAAPAPAPRARRPRSTVRKGAKTTVRLYPDQRHLLGRLADEHGVWRTELVAAAIDRYAPAVSDAGPIFRPPRRPKGPLPGEELRDYQIAVDAAHWRQLQVTADKVSGGDCSAVLRSILDHAFTKAGYTLGDRPSAPTSTLPIDI